jgi:hypothetical protein
MKECAPNSKRGCAGLVVGLAAYTARRKESVDERMNYGFMGIGRNLAAPLPHATRNTLTPNLRTGNIN